MRGRVARSLLASLLVVALSGALVESKAGPGRPARSGGGGSTAVGRAGGAPPRRSTAGSARRGPPAKRPRESVEYDDDDEEEFAGDNDADARAEEDEDDVILDDDDLDDEAPLETRERRRPSPSSRTARNAAVSKRRPTRSRYAEDDGYDNEYDDDDSYGRSSSRRGAGSGRRGPPSGGRRSGSGRRGAVVPYGRGPPPSPAFTRGIAALRSSLPDPERLKAAALTSIKAARETTSSLSSNLYRDIKGLTSSELEQVMLKSTRPDDTPVKGKHVERLVGVTYQISARFDIYDAVLRKLWAKMAEKDWRTTLKALYILHRFSSDGAPDHAPALKARLRELRRTRDPKRKDKYFNSKQLLAGDTNAENIKFRAFLSRYAHYVLMRAQCFSGMFDEIGKLPKVDPKKKPPKPITATCLKAEHLEAVEILLKAGVACQLKDGEECENTAIAVERVASDLIGLTSATATALNRALKEDDLMGADPVLLKKWCLFYRDELLPQTKAMVKKTSPKLDAYGLFLPSRMGTTVSRDLLEKGLNLKASDAKTPESASGDTVAAEENDADNDRAVKEETPAATRKSAAASSGGDDAIEEGAAADEEYEYDDEEYYDDEED